jgi:hypothetical protein
VQKELKSYHATFGPASQQPPDVQELTQMLNGKEDELRTARLQIQQLTQAETAMYTELDKLSAAWEALDRQVQSKVFELSGMEEKLTKAGLEVYFQQRRRQYCGLPLRLHCRKLSRTTSSMRQCVIRKLSRWIVRPWSAVIKYSSSSLRSYRTRRRISNHSWYVSKL